MTPMIDVVFNLLVFFIYALVYMVRVDIVPMDLRGVASGEAAKPAPIATISIDLDGSLFVDRQPTTLEGLAAVLLARREREPDLAVYIALADGEGSVDRAPMLQDLWDRLRPLELPVHIVGKPAGRRAP
jgi:biopolymer transport protein ExbD